MDRRAMLRTSGVLASAALVGGAGGCGPGDARASAMGGAGDAQGPGGRGGEGGGPGQALFQVPRPTVPIAGSDQVFPVRRIYCIGRNYAAHAIEMGSDPDREPPFFFQKPSDAVQPIAAGRTGDHPYPTLTRDYHHEIELVVALRRGGRDIAVEDALDHVFGYAVGLDMTRRDLQSAMKDQAKPWEIGKSFDHSAPLGPIHPATDVGHLSQGAITLSVNDELRQDADLGQMIWRVPEQIAQLSRANELHPGDLIFSGTPANVGPVVPGDVMVGRIQGLPDLSVRVVQGPVA